MEEKRYLKRKEKALTDGTREQLAVACKLLGDFYNEQGKYQLAIKEYQQEAEIYAKMQKKLDMAKAHRMVGEMFMILSEFQSAKEHINIYLKTAKKLQNKVEEQRAYATLGRAHLLHAQNSEDTSAVLSLEELKAAEKAFVKSLLLIKELTGQISKLEQWDMQARCYLNIGVVKEHMGQFEESISHIEKAIHISRSNDIFELTHLCYISMSLLYQYKKYDVTLALRYCNLALEIAKRLQNKVKKICETLITKSEILIKAGDFASAKQILTKAYKKNTPDENDRQIIEKSLRTVVKICRTLDELITCSSVDFAKRKELFEKLGDGCCNLQNYTKALEFYHQMLECAEKNGATAKELIPIYVSLYQTYKDNKQYDEALEYLWKEYDLNKNIPEEAFLTLCGIAEICELQGKSYWTVQDIYAKAKAEAVKVNDLKLEKLVFVRLHKLQSKHGFSMLCEELENEAKNKGIDLVAAIEKDDSDDDESENCNSNHNTPDMGDDVCLDELTDTDTSDIDESEKPRQIRATRGTRCMTIKRNNKGETQLHQACIAGNIELVRRLLDQGHAINVRDHAGWIPLHEACNHGFRDIVELLIDRGGAIAINDKGGTSCDGITPLYDACSNGYLDVVELLLEKGADPTLKTDFGETCVDGLDKWRQSTDLSKAEQMQYLEIRSKLSKLLNKVGMCVMQTNLPITTNNFVTRRDDKYQSLSDMEPEDDKTIEQIKHPIHNRSFDSSYKIQKHSIKKSPRVETASSDYRNVMEQLKHPNRLPMLDKNFYGSSCSSFPANSKQKRSALLDSEEIDDNEWLIDDVGPDKKKRRCITPTKEDVNYSNNCCNKSISKENLHDSANATWEMESLTPEADAFRVLLDSANNSTSTQFQQFQRRKSQKLSLSRSSSMSSNSSASINGKRNKTKHQSSLLDSGFCRFRSESPNLSEESNSDVPATTSVNYCAAEPDSTTAIQVLISPAKDSPIKLQATQILSTTISFKIKVEEELLLVPIERKKLNDVNIRWLAEEAARRYYNLVGMKPVLRLKTTDGYAYEENDSVNVAVEHNMILASVLEWEISPLVQRYEKMCQQLHKEISNEIQCVLERAETTNTICCEDLWLTPELTEPVFKAVLHQTNLRVLQLANNFIQNEGCRQLSKSLSTLKQLKVLDLKGNFITYEGLEVLLNNSSIEKLEFLEELNFSQNPLGDECIRIIDKFCNCPAAKTLQKLFISQCDITNLYDYNLCFYQLISFDISFNQLTDESTRKLMTKLNSSRLQYLNLSYIKSPNSDERSLSANAERFVSLFENGTCEKFKRIELCGCCLSDENIFKIGQYLSKAKDFEYLDITDNAKVSASSLQLIVDKIPQLRKLVAINCKQLINTEIVQKLSEQKHIPNFMSLTLGSNSINNEIQKQELQSLWQQHWGESAKVKSCKSHLYFYVNDNDLRSI